MPTRSNRPCAHATAVAGVNSWGHAMNMHMQGCLGKLNAAEAVQ